MSVCAYDKIVRNIITQANLFTDFSVRDCNKKQENYEQGWLCGFRAMVINDSERS